MQAAIELMDEGSELSLRAVAGRVDLTGPALSRYVDHHQHLVELVAVQVDRAAAGEVSAAVSSIEEDDPVASPTTATSRPTNESGTERHQVVTVTATGLLATS